MRVWKIREYLSWLCLHERALASGFSGGSIGAEPSVSSVPLILVSRAPLLCCASMMPETRTRCAG